MPCQIDIEKISKKYVEISGSDIANCVLMAALYAAIEEQGVVTESYFVRSLENIINAKKANISNGAKIVSQREVTEEYAMKQIGGKI